MANTFQKKICNEMAAWNKNKKSQEYFNIRLHFNEEKMGQGYSIIFCNNPDSPFYGLFLYFKFTCPHDYPFNPPVYDFISPKLFGEGTNHCRIHPNLYASGKVCLSILGTWQGDPWTPIYTNWIINKTIEGLLDENPICHEPHYNDTKKDNPTAINYTTNSKYRSLCIMVNMMKKFMNREKYPDITDLPFKDWVLDMIIKNKNIYVDSFSKLNKVITQSTLHGNEECDFPTLYNKLINMINSLSVNQNNVVSSN